MKISVYGAGYVGLVTGVCLADVGNDVLIIDADRGKIDRLNQGDLPIYEPGLEALITKNAKAGRLRFTTDPVLGAAHGLFQFIAVGTPSDSKGEADLQYVFAVASAIGEQMREYRIIVNKSTAPVGTGVQIQHILRHALAERTQDLPFSVVSNPEFLKEGDAVKDFMHPDRIIIGTDCKKAIEELRALYAPFNREYNRLMIMDMLSAELTKYAANAMLAARISFMNELSHIAEQVGADIEQVRLGIGADPRIGYRFIYPGCGYGGSCFPKDISALRNTAKKQGYDPVMLNAIEQINEKQKSLLFHKINQYFEENLKGKTIALWGLAFKPNTDDMREASSRVLMEKLWQAGAKVQAYDPIAMIEAKKIYGQRDDFVLCNNAKTALIDADALAIVTEWQEFQNFSIELFKQCLKRPVIFDGRNIYDPILMAAASISYFGIGRGERVKEPQQ